MVKRVSNVPKRNDTQDILARLDRIEAKLDKSLKIDEAVEAKVEKEERTEEKIEQKEAQIKKDEERMERVIAQIGSVTFKHKHLMEGIRGTAGAFLGVGLGRGLLNMEALASALPWWKVIGLLVFILGISALLIYKNLRKMVEQHGSSVVWRRLFAFYAISLVIELFALWLFGGIPASGEVLVKILIIGSYAAMAGAVSLLVI